jgi:dolichol-phosphate mannosyltransferase
LDVTRSSHDGAGPAWVVLPTYNEADNIARVVEEVLAALPPEGRILIVDDASPDGTGVIACDLAKAHSQVEVLNRVRRDGLGPAYLAGFRHALDAGAGAVCQMDADLSHDPADLQRLLGALSEADVVLGSRYVGGGRVENWNLVRRSVSRLGCWYARRVLRLPVRDLTGGFKAFRREVVESLDFSLIAAHGYVFQVETTYRACRSGFQIAEVPIRFRDREHGKSKMTPGIALEAAWRIPALRWRLRKGSNRNQPDFAPMAFPQRVLGGMVRPENWRQLGRFALVGASGYLINLATFAVLTHAASLHYVAAGIGAFVAAVSSNFFFNRRWTFPASDGSSADQAARFLAVSVLGLGLSLAFLRSFVGLGTPILLAQASAVACVMPISFAGNKLWTFAARATPPALGMVARRPWARVSNRLRAQGRQVTFWVLFAIATTLVLRAPWLDTPLGNDEGGLAYIASSWNDDGPFLYGDSFIDRPPGLLLIFRLAAATGGTAAVRTIGVVAAILLILIVTMLVRELGGNRPAKWGAALTGLMASSAAMGATFLPAEALAVLPSAGSVLLLVIAARLPRPRAKLLFAAGALAIISLLVKQSFGDALIAGVVFLAAAGLLGRFPKRDLLKAAAAYSLGALTVIAALETWEHVTGAPNGAMSYALIGFRLDGLDALAGSAGGLPGRFAERLLPPLVASGLVLLIVWSVVGLRRLASDRLFLITMSAWGAAGAVGVLAGGSYWPHYLLQLVPFLVVTASLALAANPGWRTKATAATLASLAVGALVVGPSISSAAPDVDAPVAGRYLRELARPGDTAYVLYSQPNILYYSGMRSPYPYSWSLMMRVIPDAEARLRALLRSPRRPTWILGWNSPDDYELDANGKTERLLAVNYHEVTEVCGYPVLLRNGVRRVLEPPPSACAEDG